MLDVGQGDSFLIETPEKNILLDAGDVGSPLVDKLKAAGIERLERVILTHPHVDHIGGVKSVLDNFPLSRKNMDTIEYNINPALVQGKGVCYI